MTIVDVENFGSVVGRTTSIKHRCYQPVLSAGSCRAISDHLAIVITVWRETSKYTATGQEIAERVLPEIYLDDYRIN